MIGALIAGVAGLGGLLASGAGAAAGLGASILGGLGSAAGGLVAAGGSVLGGVGSALGGGATVGSQMAAIAQPAYYETAGGIGAGLFDVLSSPGAAALAGTAGSIYSIFNKPDTPATVPIRTGGTLPAGYVPAINSTLPNMAGFMPQPATGQRVFQTAAPAVTPGPDVTVYILIAAAIFILLSLKKGK